MEITELYLVPYRAEVETADWAVDFPLPAFLSSSSLLAAGGENATVNVVLSMYEYE